MRRTATVTAASALAAMLIAGSPAVWSEPAESTQNAPTAAGSARTDPGAGVDRMGQDTVVPAAVDETFTNLDQNQDDYLDQDELSVFGSSAAGSNAESEDKRGEQNLQFYDVDDDDAVSREEFRRGQSGEQEGED
jgi:hypothetical protein